jgi:hypothetical protein
MSASDLSYYDLLGVSSNASDAEIERAYRALLPKVHPDISRLDNLDTRRLAAVVNQAWLTLHDPEKRKAYDESLKSGGQPAAAAAAPKVEELSDRARGYVEQLEKSRAHWDVTRKRAEEERVAREREALVLAHARETAQRAGVRRTTPVTAVAGLPRVPWSTALVVAALIVIIGSGAWLLLRPHGEYRTAGGAAAAHHKPPAKALPTASVLPKAQGNTNAMPSPQAVSATHASAIKHDVPAQTAQPTATNPPPVKIYDTVRVSTVAVAPIHPSAQAAHQATVCRDSHVSSIASGSIIETSDGSYRVDDPTMQRQARTWTAGDAITICARTAQDGSTLTLLANSVRGTVQGVQVKTPTSMAAYGSFPICTSTSVTRVADDGATVQTRDGRTFLINQDESMRQEARSWGTPAAVTICSTTERDGSVHASIVASDTISVQGTLLKTH